MSDPSEPRDSRAGRLTIFLGMAPGVGKTVRMLQDGHAAQAAGRDVAIGLLETHGRHETALAATGLELLARRRVLHRGATLDEFDLPGVLARAPELCLIDELAHTNAPGLEHQKRYEDIRDVRAAGIDVLSTVNVQHLESLNDLIAELSGVRVRETIPDGILSEADEVVLIDLSPEALLGRVRDGKIYAPEKISASLNGFFRIENLQALREVALRQVAEEVESKRLVHEVVGTREESVASEGPLAVGERLLALVEPVPGAQRLTRRAWRSAQRLGADLDLLWVASPGERSEEERRQLAALRELASLLGVQMLTAESDDVAEAVARVARERGSTYILLGASRPRRGARRLSTPLPQRLIELIPGVDVRIVSDRARRETNGGR